MVLSRAYTSAKTQQSPNCTHSYIQAWFIKHKFPSFLSFQQPNKQTDTGDDTTSAAALTNTELVLHATAEVSTANLQ